MYRNASIPFELSMLYQGGHQNVQPRMIIKNNSSTSQNDAKYHLLTSCMIRSS